MAPTTVSHSASKDVKRESTQARILGAGTSIPPYSLYIIGDYYILRFEFHTGCAGISELIIFHPVDTIAKRLMSNQSRVSSIAQFNAVIFRDLAAPSTSYSKRFFSLFPGLGFAAAYKVLQRVYKYGGQPFVRDYLAVNHGDKFDGAFGKGTGKAIMHATAGRYLF